MAAAPIHSPYVNWTNNDLKSQNGAIQFDIIALDYIDNQFAKTLCRVRFFGGGSTCSKHLCVPPSPNVPSRLSTRVVLVRESLSWMTNQLNRLLVSRTARNGFFAGLAKQPILVESLR